MFLGPRPVLGRAFSFLPILSLLECCISFFIDLIALGTFLFICSLGFSIDFNHHPLTSFCMKRFLLFLIGVVLALLTLNSARAQTYCNSNFTSASFEFITNVNYAGINNSSQGNIGGPVNYLSLAPAQVVIGTPNPLSVTIQADGGDYVYAFIDWNQNGVLNDAGEVYVVASNTSSNGPHVITITPPATATPGITRMRVMVDWSNALPNPCRSATWGEAEDYRVQVSQPQPCATITYPTTATTTVSPASLCGSGTVSLGLNSTPAMPPIALNLTYIWQSGPSATGPWGLAGTSSGPTFTTASINANTFFRCLAKCNSDTALISTPTQVTVLNPGVPTVTNGTRCGPGVVALSATPTAGNTIRWYSSLTSTVPLAATNNYTTPYLTQNGTYYATTVSNASWNQYNTGLPATIQNNPFITTSAGWGVRFTVTATCNIDSVGVYPIGTGTLSMRIWNATTQAVVYTSPVSPTITGTGVEKRMIAVGATALPPGTYVMGIGSFTGLSNLRNEGFNAVAYPFTCPALSITAGSQGFGSPTSNVYYFSYDWRVSTMGGCEGARVPVTATVTPSTPIAKDFPAIVCNNAPAKIQLTPPTPGYSGYTWTQPNNLFTDAAATVPYVAGTSATTIYARTTTYGQHTYYLMAGNPNVPTGCTFADTFKIWVQPGNVTIKAQPDTICISGQSTLSLVPNEGYSNNTIKWQQSLDNVLFVDINGATGISYTTPVLTFGQNTYFRALISAGSQVCESPGKYIVIANPTLTNTKDSFHCGPGTVFLQANTGGNATPKWYDVPTGGAAIGTGTQFETPLLTATKTFYVTAAGGSTLTSVGKPTIVSTSGNTGTSTGIIFDALSDVHIASVAVYPYGSTQGPATITVQLRDAIGNVLQTYTGNVNITTTLPTVKVELPISFTVPQGSNYRLVWASSTGALSGLGRESTAANFSFPYTLPGLIKLTNSTSTGFYYYFYDWKIKTMCETPRTPVVAYIHPVPEIDLGQDINRCVDSGTNLILNAGVQPFAPQFLWDDGTVSQVRAINTSGQYYVQVTNQYTCVGYDTIQVTLHRNPVVELGNDTSVCNGVVITLDAGNDGTEYYWNTGSTNKKIDAEVAGTYVVFVTNGDGCIKSDTIHIDMNGELPKIDYINVRNDGQTTFTFKAVNPQNVIGYEWDFGDFTPHSYQAEPTHRYVNSGYYNVVLLLSSTCGFAVDSLSANIVGIGEIPLFKEGLKVYPNPAKDKISIEVAAASMERIEMYNILGQLVYTLEVNGTKAETVDVGGLAVGLYTVKVFTDKGILGTKFEIMD